VTFVSCKVTEKTVIGTYESNYQETLTLNSNKTFGIEYEIHDTVLTIFRGTKKISGQWKLINNSVSLLVDDKKYDYWECVNLGVKRKELTRPLHCSPTHRFKIFKKVNPVSNKSKDTITNWQIYLGKNNILSENKTDQYINGLKIIHIKKNDLINNSSLNITIQNCLNTNGKRIEIQFGNDDGRYSQNYYNINKINIDTKFILDLLKSKATNQIILSISTPPFTQPSTNQYGLFLVDLRVN
jgi:hypothetical protein